MYVAVSGVPPLDPAGQPLARGTMRVSSLDGLRALAALAVFGFHAGWVTWRSGWLGVDVFFVLSGYLITTLLVRERTRSGRLDLVRFLKARALRLFPPLLVVVLGSAALYAVLPSKVPQRSLLHSAITSLTYTQNLVAARHPALADPLIHTWSLAEEQQFYLVWPVVLGLLLTVSRHVAAAAAVLLAVASALLLLATSHGTNPAAYYWPWTRSSGLALGAALALVLDSPRSRALVRRAVPALMALGALGLVAVAGWLPALSNGGWVVPTGVATASLATALLLADLVVRPDGALGRALSVAPLVHLGRWSYGFYLIHVPLLVALTAHLSRRSTALALALALSVALSALLHHAVELPMERLRHRTAPSLQQP